MGCQEVPLKASSVFIEGDTFGALLGVKALATQLQWQKGRAGTCNGGSQSSHPASYEE